MENMTDEEYIQKRVDDQIHWYDNKSKRNQQAYKWLRVYEIAAAAMIPFLTGYIALHGVKFSVGLLGVSVSIVSGALALYKFQENWVQYRSTSEALNSEKHLYLTKAPPYDTGQPFSLFVQRVESLLSKETSGWTQYVSTPVGNKPGP